MKRLLIVFTVLTSCNFVADGYTLVVIEGEEIGEGMCVFTIADIEDTRGARQEFEIECDCHDFNVGDHVEIKTKN